MNSTDACLSAIDLVRVGGTAPHERVVEEGFEGRPVLDSPARVGGGVSGARTRQPERLAVVLRWTLSSGSARTIRCGRSGRR